MDGVSEDFGKPVGIRAMECLGLGFDLTCDFRLKFAKGPPGERLVVLDEANKRDIVIPGGLTIPCVSEDIRCDKGDRIRFKSDVLEFNQVILSNSSFFFSVFFFWRFIEGKNTWRQVDIDLFQPQPLSVSILRCLPETSLGSLLLSRWRARDSPD